MNLSKKPYKGTRDFFPEEMRLRRYIFDVIEKTCHQYGYSEYQGPLIESLDLYKAKSGDELINEQVYSFTDRGGREVAIRPEMTPTLARMVAQIYREKPLPLRLYSIPNLMRYERPQRGRLREHWQLNLDIFGAPRKMAALEVFSFISSLMTNFKASSKHYCIKVNDRQFVDSLLKDKLALDDETNYKIYKLIDKSKKISSEQFQTELSELVANSTHQALIKSYLELQSIEEAVEFGKSHDLYVQDLIELLELVQKNHSLSEVCLYDPQIIRGLDYYTGVVFEVFDLHPQNKRAIAGGGVYSKLLTLFNEKECDAMGLGLGDVTLQDFLQSHDLLPKQFYNISDCLVTFLDHDLHLKAFEFTSTLRQKGLNVELWPDACKVNKAFKAALAHQHQRLIIIGENEIEKEKFKVKNIITQNEVEFTLEEINKENILKV